MLELAVIMNPSYDASYRVVADVMRSLQIRMHARHVLVGVAGDVAAAGIGEDKDGADHTRTK